MATHRVGLLGAGYIADWHADALAAMPEVNIAAVCDQHFRRAQTFAQRHKIVQAFKSLGEMLEAERLDVVHVLLPPDQHFSAGRSLLDAGVHVLLEKPMCVTADECKVLSELAQRKGLIVGVSHNYLFYEVYEQLKNDLTRGNLGRVEQIVITRNCELELLRTGPFDAWMLSEPQNIILELGPHSIGQILDLVGPLDELETKASDAIDLPGGARFYRRWRISGSKGDVLVELRYSFRPGFPEDTIRVRGTLASATADFERNTYVLHRHRRMGIDLDRYFMVSSEARELRHQARRTLLRYVLSKVKPASEGNAFGASIARSLKAFYAHFPDHSDRRLSCRFGLEIIRLCERIGRSANVAGSERAQRRAVPRESGSRPEVLVLGGTGFIGRHLVRQLLSAGHHVRLLVRSLGKLPADFWHPRIDLLRGDMTTPADVDKAMAGVNVVYHLARAIGKTWNDYYVGDVLATKAIAEKCLERRVKRLIYTGTIASYYAGIHAGTVTEETPLDRHIHRREYYSRAKAAAEVILTKMHHEQGLPVVIFRPGIVLGSGGNPFHWGIGMWSWDSICRFWGEGTSKLPIVLVDDVCEALVAALYSEGLDGESFNLVAYQRLTAREYVHELERCAGINITKIPTAIWKFYVMDMFKCAIKSLVGYADRRLPSYRDWESRTLRAHFDCSKARKLLKWQPNTDRAHIIREGIQVPAGEFLGQECG